MDMKKYRIAGSRLTDELDEMLYNLELLDGMRERWRRKLKSK